MGSACLKKDLSYPSWQLRLFLSAFNVYNPTSVDAPGRQGRLLSCSIPPPQWPAKWLAYTSPTKIGVTEGIQTQLQTCNSPLLLFHVSSLGCGQHLYFRKFRHSSYRVLYSYFCLCISYMAPKTRMQRILPIVNTSGSSSFYSLPKPEESMRRTEQWPGNEGASLAGSVSDSHLTKDKSFNLSLPCFYCMQNRGDNNISLLLPLEGYSENWGDAIWEVIRALKNWALHTEAVLFSGCATAAVFHHERLILWGLVGKEGKLLLCVDTMIQQAEGQAPQKFNGSAFIHWIPPFSPQTSISIILYG